MQIDAATFRASWQSWAGGSLDRSGPYWMQWLWTLLFCLALAVPFTVFGFFAFARDSEGAWRNWSGWLYWYGRNLVVCLTIGVLIHAVFDLLRDLTGTGTSVVLITHDLELARSADRTVELVDGKVTAEAGR